MKHKFIVSLLLGLIALNVFAAAPVYPPRPPGGITYDATFTNIVQSLAGGGVVSNEVKVASTTSIFYTNTTPYQAFVAFPVGANSGEVRASVTNANGTLFNNYDVTFPTDQTTNQIEFIVPAGAHYLVALNGGGNITGSVGDQVITYFGSGGGGTLADGSTVTDLNLVTPTLNNAAFTGSNYFTTVYAGNVVGDGSGLSNVTAQTLGSADSWSIAIFPDTQYLVSRSGGPAEFNTAANWITNSATRYNIKAVLHEGDIVENYGSSPSEWVAASNSLTRIKDAGIPIVLAAGNHDVDASGTKSWTNYGNYFPRTWFHPSVQFSSPTGSNVNHYVLQTNSGVPWIFLTMEWAPPPAVVNWASNTFQIYSNHNAALLTHAFCTADGTLERDNTVFTQHNWVGEPTALSATRMWTNTFSKLPNLRMVLNGHYVNITGSEYLPPAVANTMLPGVNGNPVYFMAFNYQNTGNGVQHIYNYVRLLTFDDKKAYARTYNPSLGIWSTNLNDSFTLDWSQSYFPPQFPESVRVRGIKPSWALESDGQLWRAQVQTNMGLEYRAGAHPSGDSNPVVRLELTNAATFLRTNFFAGPTNTLYPGLNYYVTTADVSVTNIGNTHASLAGDYKLWVSNAAGSSRVLAATFPHTRGFHGPTNSVTMGAGEMALMEVQTFGSLFTNVSLRLQTYGSWAPEWTPTNSLPGYTPYAWYVASDYHTNAGIATWPNRIAGGSAINLTNHSAASFPTLSLGALGGRDTLLFNGELTFATASWLRSVNFTTAGSPNVDAFIVMNIRDQVPGSSGQTLWDNHDGSANRKFLFHTAGGSLQSEVAYPGFEFDLGETWYVYHVNWNSPTTVYTNNAVFYTVGNSTASQVGITIGSRYTLDARATKMDVAEIIIYTGAPTPGTNTTARTAIYDYLRNKYGL